MNEEASVMPICQTEFEMVEPEQINSALSSLTRECFVDGMAAYKPKEACFSIDAGENDITAIYDEEDKSIKFICRYQRQLNYYDNQLSAFAAKHGVFLKRDSNRNMAVNNDRHIL
ncbi:hypothetical protein ACFO4O_15160 [Glaciecola siphonariae]|uniref:Uncharacterized protein n=1 Tax=Glaciecola siphonariae TaxID=521012 RepID=A0ABV9LY61_9ALTE